MKTISKKYDLAVVGAGIVGLAHAYIASKAGKRVLLLERNQFALSASVRNFGLVWPVGQAHGHMLERALRSRAVWEEIAHKAGFWLNKNGSMHLAYHEDEWKVLQEFSEQAGEAYQSKLLKPEEVTSLSPLVKANGLKGGLMSQVDCTVDPREAIRKLAEYLASGMRVDVRFGKTVVGIDPDGLHTFDEKFYAEQMVICNGADFETLYPSLIRDTSIQKCKLQMMRTTPIKEKLGPSLCAGLTLLHYDAFVSCPSLHQVAKRYALDSPEYQAGGIHVLVSQNELGELVLGDTHAYGMDHYPFNQSEMDLHVLEYLQTFFHSEELRIKERWEGIYPKMMDGNTELILQPESNVLIVTGIGGAGMTLSFGLAQENFNRYLS